MRFAVVGIALQSAMLAGLGTFAGNLAQAPTMKIAEVVRTLPEDMPIFSFNLNAPSVSFYAQRSYEIVLGEEAVQKLEHMHKPHAVILRSEAYQWLPYLQGYRPAVEQGGYLLYVVSPASKRAP